MTETKDLHARLAAAQARIAAVEASRADEESEEAALTKKVEKLELNAANAEAIEVARAKYGEAKIAVVETPKGGIVIVRTPHNTHYARFRDKGAHKTEDMMKLALVSLAYPTTTAFEAIVEEFPGMLDRVANQAVTLAGFRSAELSEK